MTLMLVTCLCVCCSVHDSNYIDEMYLTWQKDPAAVHKSWDAYFKTGSYQAPPTLVADYSAASGRRAPAAAMAPSGDAKAVNDTVAVVQLMRAFQVRGHYIAKLDPLGIHQDGMARGSQKQELELTKWGFTDADLDREFDVSQQGMEGFCGADRGKMSLRNIYRRLNETYCKHIGLEYMHIPDRGLCNWIRSKVNRRGVVCVCV
jgi:2-oxoglutarate dehydrogenase E1 component